MTEPPFCSTIMPEIKIALSITSFRLMRYTSHRRRYPDWRRAHWSISASKFNKLRMDHGGWRMKEAARRAVRGCRKTPFFEQPLDWNHAFNRILTKSRALRAQFFVPCIIPEVHAPGNYEFAVQILFYACCHTKGKNDRLTLSTDWSRPKGGYWINALCALPKFSIFNSPFSMKEKQQVQLNLLFFFTLPDFRRRHNQFPRPAGRYSSTR